MTRNLNLAFQSSTSTQQFLLSKIETKPKPEIPSEKAMAARQRLAEAFPDLLSGTEFIETAMQRISPVFQFAAMVIKIDDFSKQIDSNLCAEIWMDVGWAIDACCREENGFWGQIETKLFACFFPDKSATACLNTAKRIQSKISTHRKETVSIGIAAYPTINYQKHQVLDNARKALEHALFFGSNSVVSFDSVSLNISGDNRYAAGDIDGAIEEFKRALLLDPTNANVHNSLGVCYGVQGELDKALDEFETTIWLEPEEFMAIYNIGMVHFLKGNKPGALEFFVDASRLSEDVFEVLFQTGRVYVEIGKPRAAEPYLKKAIRLRPTSVSAFRYMGECYAALGNINEALSAYKSAVKINPNDAASLSAMGYLYDLQGENPEICTTFCLQSVEICPDNGLYRHRLASLYLKQNRYAEALREFEAAKELGCDCIEDIEHIQNRLAAKAL
ncbi:MAG: tetratricopeptide repeat protein [Deltaproteobacteria bacterium]|nr:tetratricopeptide repeat protein [Deltaproteobacteria bacterium]